MKQLLEASLENLLGEKLIFIKAKKKNSLDLGKSFSCEGYFVGFENGKYLKIATEDNPHFWGDGELLVGEIKTIENKNYRELFNNEVKGSSLNAIKLVYWKRNGIILFNTFSLAQIIFYFTDNFIVNCGLIHCEKGQTNLIGATDIYLGLDDFNISSINENYYVKVIKKQEY